MNILVADDSTTNRKLTRVQLEARGHTVVEAIDGVDALRVLEHENVDGIVSDILMPNLDGYGLCSEVRKNERLRHLPLGFQTGAFFSSTDEKLALDVGADRFFRKPLPAGVLIKALEEVAVERKQSPPQPVRFPKTDLLQEYSKRLVDRLEETNSELTLKSTALEAAANAITIIDCRGAILWVNPAFTKLTGYTATEVRGKNPRLLKSGQHDRAFYRDLWETILAGHTWRGELTNRRKDGSIYVGEQTITPVCSADGVITHFVGIMIDITERKRAEEELRATHEQMRQLLTHSPAVMYRLTIDGQTVAPVFVSDNIQRLLGVGVAESTRYEWWLDSLHPDDRDRVLAGLANGLTQGGYSMEYRVRHKDGTYRWIEDDNRVLRGDSGQPKEAVGVWTDITERKRAEEGLRGSEAQLRQTYLF